MIRYLRVLLVALACLAPACAAEPLNRPARDRIVLGGLGALSGEGSEVAAGILRGVELAISEYNTDPDSRYEVGLQRADTKQSTEAAVAAATDLTLAAGLVGVIGPFRAEEVEVVGSVFETTGIAFLVPSVSDSAVGGWGTFRRLVPNDAVAGEAVGAEAAARARRDRVAIFYDEGPLSVAGAEGAKRAIEMAKGTLARFEALGPKTDLGGLATGLAGESPAAVIFFGPSERAASFSTALKGAGFTGRVMVPRMARDRQFTELVADKGEGILGTSIPADPGDPSLERFATAHRDRFKSPPALFAAEAYEGALMLLEAAEAVDGPPSAQAVTHFLRSARRFTGDSRTYAFNEQGELLASPVWVLELRGGQWQLVGRSSTPALP